jgi:3-deoxy-D-manno-octulosonic-acid transferase
MRLFTALVIYRLVLPLVFVAAFPGWVVKMLRRGGLETRLGERVAIYSLPTEHEPSGAVHVHAVSVGEVLGSKEFVLRIMKAFPDRRVVISTTTRTGQETARSVYSGSVKTFYFPLDLDFVIKKVADLIKPELVIIFETEL